MRHQCAWAHRGQCVGVSHLRNRVDSQAPWATLCERHLTQRRILRAVLKREQIELPEESPEWFAAALLLLKGTL